MRMISRNLVLLLPLLLMIQLNKGLVFKLTNAVCESKNQTWITVENCRLRAIQRNKTVINLFLNFLQPANAVIIDYQIQKRANGYKPWVIKGSFDLCKYMIHSKDKFAKLLFDQIGDYTTLNHTCPFVGKQSIQNYYPSPEKLPIVFPTGEYAFLVKWNLSGRTQLTTNIYFTFVENLLSGS